MDAKTKICSRCRKRKRLDKFCYDKKSKDGKQSQCKACKNEQVKAYYATPQGSARKWSTMNPDKERARSIRRYRENKVSWNIARMIRKSLGCDKGGMMWETVVGFTLEELREHLETRFKPGMTWDNYGEWHIDHVRPVSSFEIDSVHCDAFRECWSLANLQPLWACENLSKGNRFQL